MDGVDLADGRVLRVHSSVLGDGPLWIPLVIAILYALAVFRWV
jgi:hypothetical protein